jgi:DNA-binding response OmpR family regulator
MSINLTAVVLVNDPGQVRPALDALSRKGFSTLVRSDPAELLESCKVSAPDLIIVEDRLPGMSGIQFLAALLKIAWTTATVLVIDEEEESVHEKTEGLGILGSMRDLGDTGRLEQLLDKALELMRCSEFASVG